MPNTAKCQNPRLLLKCRFQEITTPRTAGWLRYAVCATQAPRYRPRGANDRSRKHGAHTTPPPLVLQICRRVCASLQPASRVSCVLCKSSPHLSILFVNISEDHRYTHAHNSCAFSTNDESEECRNAVTHRILASVRHGSHM